jgi:endonuclease/exonuclease/phosphatase family metal-dependent hydrolase
MTRARDKAATDMNPAPNAFRCLWRTFLAVSLPAGVLVLEGCAVADLHTLPEVHTFEVPARASAVVDAHTHPTLSVMTLNIAHGRGKAFHQLLQDSVSTVRNLNGVATMLVREQPDVVALQEADGPSYWSGGFHHVDYLARQAVFANAVNGMHVDGLGLAYGTALLSRLELRDAEAITFNPDLAMTPKGFVVSTINWPGQGHVQVDVVSLHLDFSSEKTRQQQALEVIGFMRDRNRPMIVMGDFNADWGGNASAVRLIAEALSLKAYDPASKGQITFPYRNKRLDWILVSSGLEFRNYRVIADAVSDHRGVIAELGMGTPVVKADNQSPASRSAVSPGG